MKAHPRPPDVEVGEEGRAGQEEKHERSIVLDVETTGMDPVAGDRVIEIGCVELLDRRVTGEEKQWYLNPEREVSAGAARIHGMTWDDLAAKPLFKDIATEFLEFVRGAQLVIHNAPFDIAFLNAELARLGEQQPSLTDYCTVLDTLELARNRRPGLRNNLEALCRHYGVDSSEREHHGALLDARLLSKVYLEITSGQASLLKSSQATHGESNNRLITRPPGKLRLIQPDPQQLAEDRRIRESLRQQGPRQQEPKKPTSPAG